MSDNSEHLPIKVVIPSEGDIHPPRKTAPRRKDFTEDYDQARETVLAGLQDIARFYEPAFQTAQLPVVARVCLKQEAIAKSHRPVTLFNENCCPIIGAENFGNLLISILPGRLARLTQRVQAATTIDLRNDVSKIKSIQPFRTKDAFGPWSAETFLRYMEEHGHHSFKLRLFDHRDDRANETLLQHLNQLAIALNIQPPRRLPHSRSMPVYDFAGSTLAQLQQAAAFVGTQGLAIYEDVTISTSAIERGLATAQHIPAPDAEVEIGRAHV